MLGGQCGEGEDMQPFHKLIIINSVVIRHLNPDCPTIKFGSPMFCLDLDKSRLHDRIDTLYTRQNDWRDQQRIKRVRSIRENHDLFL